MNKMDEALNRIRILECPTGDLENRIGEIFEDYRIADRSSINITKENNLSREEAQAFRVEIADEGQAYIVLARSGSDDYVASVTDVYSIS